MEIVHTDNAPAAIGPYSQAIKSQGFLYTAGQIPLDPKSGMMVEGDIQAQTRQVFENLKAVLDAAGTGFDRVVKANVYLTDMAHFPALNEVYADYLGKAKPARATVAVSQLPKGSLVEIDLVAEV